MRVISYDKETYNFHEIIKDLIGAGALEDLTAELNRDDDPEGKNSIYKNMEQTDHYKKLYEKLDGEEGIKFYELFEKFVKNVIRPLYNESIYYQKKPTHRIHFHNSSGASRFHRDIDYGHSRVEVNYSVPQTRMYNTNSIWIETKERKEDYRAIELKIGECVEFHGAYLKHGAKENKTSDTRVSFDFRVMPKSEAPDIFTDKSTWEEKDEDNPIFKNAHNFAICE